MTDEELDIQVQRFTLASLEAQVQKLKSRVEWLEGSIRVDHGKKAAAQPAFPYRCRCSSQFKTEDDYIAHVNARLGIRG